jgi:solute:Na+ symporter, SSS family
VIGVPNEAYKLGWYAIRWIPSVICICFGYFATALRLRKASLYRNHQSPTDFVTDRYQSQVLRYTILTLQVLPTIVYLSAQVIAIKSTFNSIFELDPDTPYPAIVVMAVILLFEWVGGLSSVALTDAFQAVVMMTAFFITPIVITKNFGGWRDLDAETFPKPQLYQTMSKEQQWSFWQFSLINFSFFTLPHLVQRIYAARDLRSLKVGFAALTIGPWFASLLGVFIGTVGISILADKDGNPATPADATSAILEEMLNLGGFAKVTGAVFITSALAAIMSTADSLMIAISQLITVEIVYPLRPQATPAQMAFVGKFVSLISTIAALLLGIFWDEGLSDLTKIQFPLSAQAVPTFLFGLYSSSNKLDFHPWSLSISAIVSTIAVFVLYFSYLKPVTGSKPLDTGVIGILIQFVIVLFCEALRRVIAPDSMAKPQKFSAKNDEDADGKVDKKIHIMYPGRPAWDIPKLRRFGDHALTPELLWKSMEGLNEPITNLWWVFLMFFTISMATPWTAEFEPALDTSGSGNVFLDPPTVINGLPWWAFKSLMMCIVPTVLLFVAIYKMPDEFPVDEVKIEQEGIDTDLVELTPEEMGRRTSYDEPNVLILRRRSSIQQTMEELGIHRGEKAEFKPNMSQRKLAQLALQGSSYFKVTKEIDEEEEENEVSS